MGHNHWSPFKRSKGVFDVVQSHNLSKVVWQLKRSWIGVICFATKWFQTAIFNELQHIDVSSTNNNNKVHVLFPHLAKPLWYTVMYAQNFPKLSHYTYVIGLAYIYGMYSLQTNIETSNFLRHFLYSQI